MIQCKGKFRLSLRCFKYLDIKKSDNNKVGKFKVSSHNSPQATPFFDAHRKTN
jgi:hypothetical protein